MNWLDFEGLKVKVKSKYHLVIINNSIYVHGARMLHVWVDDDVFMLTLVAFSTPSVVVFCRLKSGLIEGVDGVEQLLLSVADTECLML